MENCGNLRNKQKTLKIAEGGGGGGTRGGRKVYAKQQTKQSRQLICWQRKGKCPNIYSILYKAEDMGHTYTEDTGHSTWDMGKQFRACWQRKFTCQKTSRWTNSWTSTESVGEGVGQTFYAFCLIKIATARGASRSRSWSRSFFSIKLALHLIKAATFVQLEPKAETETATTTSVMQLSDYLINNKESRTCRAASRVIPRVTFPLI